MSRQEVVNDALRGWRAWQVVESRDGPALASWWINAVWPARSALEARCSQHGPRPAAHHVCGIHAFSGRDDALGYLDCAREAPLLFVRQPHRALGLVVGRVSGWGRAIAHTRGWRSQFAYPYDLYVVRGDRALARKLADRYAVETSPSPPDN